MKKKIHLIYCTVVFYEAVADYFYYLRSMIDTIRTIDISGIIYQYIPRNVTTESYCKYQYEQKRISNNIRVSQFQKRFA